MEMIVKRKNVLEQGCDDGVETPLSNAKKYVQLIQLIYSLIVNQDLTGVVKLKM